MTRAYFPVVPWYWRRRTSLRLTELNRRVGPSVVASASPAQPAAPRDLDQRPARWQPAAVARKKATAEALATSFRRADAARSSTPSRRSSRRAAARDRRRPGALAGRREQGRVRLCQQVARVGARLAQEPAVVRPAHPLMASGGAWPRVSGTSFASELVALDEAAAGTARADRRRQAILPPSSSRYVGVAYVARLLADACRCRCSRGRSCPSPSLNTTRAATRTRRRRSLRCRRRSAAPSGGSRSRARRAAPSR